MKNFSIFLLVVISAFSSLKGQQYSMGLKPSFLIIGAKYTQEPIPFDGYATSLGVSYAIGISLNDQINKRFGIKIEPRLIVKGYNMYWMPHEEDKYKFRNKYLSIPIIFCYSPIHNLNVEFGPDLGILLYALDKGPTMKSYSRNNSEDLKNIEYSLVAGVSHVILKKFDVGVRYGLGLSAFEKWTFSGMWSGPDVDAKIVQNYFEFFLNTRLITKLKNN